MIKEIILFFMVVAAASAYPGTSRVASAQEPQEAPLEDSASDLLLDKGVDVEPSSSDLESSATAWGGWGGHGRGWGGYGRGWGGNGGWGGYGGYGRGWGGYGGWGRGGYGYGGWGGNGWGRGYWG